MDKMIYHEIPLLNRPYLIAGFEGWPNAAEVVYIQAFLKRQEDEEKKES
ncbi:MAG: hypothetical protein KGZ49_11130 [Syntrophaceae bacterium]|nr:hypothetical protein [Syntrophaceae bacterium]